MGGGAARVNFKATPITLRRAVNQQHGPRAHKQFSYVLFLFPGLLTDVTLTTYIPHIHLTIACALTYTTCTHTVTHIHTLLTTLPHNITVKQLMEISFRNIAVSKKHPWLYSYMHPLALASLKTWNPKERAGRETVPLASCSTGSSSGREMLSTSCSRWPFRVTCLGERESELEGWHGYYAFLRFSPRDLFPGPPAAKKKRKSGDEAQC